MIGSTADQTGTQATPDKGMLGAGLYADIENLGSHGQELIESLIDDWPKTIPPLALLALYVRADQAELWRVWATTRFKGLVVIVRGIQHFSLSSSKNSADIAIATNAMTDWVLGRVGHVAVLSDDSDFISLYASMREELARARRSDLSVPFLWIVTDRQQTVSSTVKQFFPKDQLHVVSIGQSTTNNEQQPTHKRLIPTPLASTKSEDPLTTMARTVVEVTPVGSFKSTDTQDLLRKRWPAHPIAKVDGPAFGTEFKKSIWPILEMWGVRIPNPGRKPVRYEMTEAAKKKIR